MPDSLPLERIPEEQIVVTFRQINKILTGKEAVDNIQEAANRDVEASPEERAAVMAAVGNVLTQLRKAEQDAGAVVLTAVSHGPASRLQSLIASGEKGKLGFEPFPTGGLEKFREKARSFLRGHQDNAAIRKLQTNKALTAEDLADLERVLTESGVGGSTDIQRAAAESQGLGLFVRSLVGLDREAAKEALAGFLVGKKLSANQIEFVNLIVDRPSRRVTDRTTC